MISSASLSSVVTAFNRDPQHIAKFEDPFTHKPLDKPAIITAIESQDVTAADSTSVNILA